MPGSWELAGETKLTISNGGQYSYTTTYFVHGVTTATAALNTLGIAYDDELAENPDATASNIDIKLAGQRNDLWLVTVTHQTPDPDEEGDGGGGDGGDPFSDPLVIEGDSEFFLKAVFKDLNNEAIVNSAKQPFDPPVEIEVPVPAISITKNEAGAPYAKARQYTNKVNQDHFYGAAPGTLLCRAIPFRSAQRTVNGTTVDYWQVTYRFLYNEAKWDLEIPDVGFSEIAAVEDVKRLISISEGTGYSTPPQPRALDTDGRFLPVGSPPNFKKFKVKGEATFSGLGLS